MGALSIDSPAPQLFVADAEEVRKLMDDRVPDFGARLFFRRSDLLNRTLKDRDFVGQDVAVSGGALGQRNTFVQSEQRLIGRNAHLAQFGARGPELDDDFDVS